MDKTKVMISVPQLDKLKDSGKHPCSVAGKELQVIPSTVMDVPIGFTRDVRSSNITDKLAPDPTFRCSRCLVTARPINGRPCDHVVVNDHNLGVVDSCHLGDTISAGGGWETAIITRVGAVWGKFRKMPPIQSCKTLPLTTWARIYNTCVRSAMLYGVW